MTRKQRNTLNRFNQSIALGQRVLANLQECEMVVDDGSTIALTERIIQALEVSKGSYMRRHGLEA